VRSGVGSWACALILGILILFNGSAGAEGVTKVYVSERVLPHFKFSRTQYLLIYAEPAPDRVALLFAGGNGKLNIPIDGNIPPTGLGLNFLVRSRMDFVKDGVAVAVVNVPNGIPLSSEAQRMTDAYAQDIEALIQHVRQKLPNAKVWLVGTSSGTISVVKTTAKFPKKGPQAQVVDRTAADGIVLTATQTAKHKPDAVSMVRCKGTIFDVVPPLSAIDVPSLIVKSRGDTCPCTAAPRRLPIQPSTNVLSPLMPTETVNIDDGGSQAGADVCSGLAAHGFYNKERETVDAITRFIKAN
jgi:hypothetical protein